jgi:hypothetical protein
MLEAGSGGTGTADDDVDDDGQVVREGRSITRAVAHVTPDSST